MKLPAFNAPAFLVISTTIGFFLLLTMLYFRAFPAESKEVLTLSLGTVGSAWTGIVGYYYGSSQGSAKKTDMMAKSGTETEKEK